MFLIVGIVLPAMLQVDRADRTMQNVRIKLDLVYTSKPKDANTTPHITLAAGRAGSPIPMAACRPHEHKRQLQGTQGRGRGWRRIGCLTCFVGLSNHQGHPRTYRPGFVESGQCFSSASTS